MSNDSPRWFEQNKDFKARTRDAAEAADAPDLWTQCPSCNEPLYNEVLAENLRVCHLCGHHFPIEAWARIAALADPDSWEEHDADLAPVDALGFVDSKPYAQRISATRKKTGRNDAFVSVSATIDGIPVELGCFDFRFLGGSMGSVVGEQITRLYERAAAARRPAIVISASGGARMQEGVLSLMQMAKTCAALARLQDDANMPYISVLTHPTTGGVAASFAMLGDLIVAEPGALIGFAGPRVIRETIGQELPEGFQTSEYLLENGMIDRIVTRRALRPLLIRLLRQLLHQPALEATNGASVVPAGPREVAARGPIFTKPVSTT